MNKKNRYKNALVIAAQNEGVNGRIARTTVERAQLNPNTDPGYTWTPFHKSSTSRQGIIVRVGTMDDWGNVTAVTGNVCVKPYPYPADINQI